MKLIAIGLLACASWARAADPAPSTAPAAGIEARPGETGAEAARFDPELCAPREGIRVVALGSRTKTRRAGQGCETGLKAPPPAAPPVKTGFGGGSMLFDGLSGRSSLVKS